MILFERFQKHIYEFSFTMIKHLINPRLTIGVLGFEINIYIEYASKFRDLDVIFDQ